MKVILANTTTKAKLTKSKWVRWFAWRPILLIEEGHRYFIWLESIERKTITEAFVIEGVPFSFIIRRKYRLNRNRNKQNANKS